MKNTIWATALVTLASGCAQNQTQGLRASQTTVKNFLNCGFSVRFSGAPEEIHDSLKGEIIESLGGIPEKPIWRYLSFIGGISKFEVALCVCPQEPNLSIRKTQIMKSDNVGIKNVDGIGHIYDAPMVEIDYGVKSFDKWTLGNTSDCFLVQSGGATGTPDSVRKILSPFLTSAAPLQKEQQSPVSKAANTSTAERLRQLDSLLRENLISKDEFDKRRAIILESL